MIDLAPIIQKLQQLGLTRSEAEVYVAVLQEAGAGPVSGYRVAQAMGRDPANLAKNLTALEKQGAVRTVQAKPKLYLPVLPEEFTRQLVGRIQEVGESLTDQLKSLSSPQPSGLTLSLRNNEQALEQAIVMMKECTDELLIFSSRDVVDYLGREFGELASRGNCRVRFLGTKPSGIALAEETIIPLPAGFSDDGTSPWLQLVVDRRVWLVAQFNRPENLGAPCGWWGEDTAIAHIMAGALDAACDGVPYSFTPPVSQVREPEADESTELEEVQNLEVPAAETSFESAFESGVVDVGEIPETLPVEEYPEIIETEILETDTLPPVTESEPQDLEPLAELLAEPEPEVLTFIAVEPEVVEPTYVEPETARPAEVEPETDEVDGDDDSGDDEDGCFKFVVRHKKAEE